MTQAIDFQNLTQIQNRQQNLQDEVEKEHMRRLLSTRTEGFESQLGTNFFQGSNDIQKKKKERKTKYSNAKVKTRNLLTNLYYRRYKPEDIEKNKLCYQCFFVFYTEFKSNWS